MQVPADIRRALGLADGDPVLLRIVDGELHVRPVHNALSRVQARLRAHIPAGISLSDELIAERRQASEHE
ncbi:AbrB/MazE/SpoVT family DNA-binding domain-containing protein [Novosphingobium colocasiae]